MKSSMDPAQAAGPCVSVVIPVFRASRFVAQAVESALDQAETMEVVVIEDGSPDDSLEVCLGLQRRHPSRIRVLTHAANRNLGAGASRNLGIRTARGRYLSFLDADDYMLKDRFGHALAILEAQPATDGVYETVAVDATADDARPHPSRGRFDGHLIGMTEPPPPSRLLELLVSGERGVFHTNGVLLRSRVFDRVGLFNTELRLAQDSEMWWRIASVCSLVGGAVDRPVAVVRRHRDNRWSSDNPQIRDSQFRVALSAWMWARVRDDVPRHQREVLYRGLEQSIAAWPWEHPGHIRLRWIQLGRWLRAVPACPSLLGSRWLWAHAVGRRARGTG